MNNKTYGFYGWETADITDANGLTPRDYYDLLSKLWCAKTCAPRMRQDWSADNKTLGQCSITAFLMQDIFGGKVYGILRSGGNYHCFNDVDGCVFDLTSEQFGNEKLDYSDCPEQFREVHFQKEEKKQRYFQLKEMLEALLKEEKKLETKRLILRRWADSDAEDLYKYASDPDVGPIAGWPPHKSIDESRDIIKNVLSGKEAYAICLKEDGKAIGTIELKLNGHTDMTDRDDECEMGFWLGKPFWGRGIMPEAAEELLRHAFEDCGMKKVWCAYYEGNAKSKRTQEKCRFRYQWKSEGVDVPLMHEKRDGYVNSMTKDQWQWDRLYDAALAVRKERRISEYVTCGEVSAAILSSTGKIYTGVCIDTCSTLGICAERNAIFNMITNGEQEIEKVLAILPDGTSGAPCGACRELMVQLMPEKYKGIEILMDYKEERTMTLGELTPEWWI